MPRLNSVQMQSGWDQSLSDSDNIEAFTPSGGSPQTIHVSKAGDVYIFVDGDPEDYSRGQERISGNAGFSYVGKQQVQYKIPRIHVDSLAWLIDNYQGQVTVQMRTDRTTYASYNCWLTIPQQNIRKLAMNFREALMVFTIEEAL